MFLSKQSITTYLLSVAIIIKYTHSANTLCNTEFECVGQSINADVVGADGYKSLLGANITAADSIYCQGSFSCNNVSWMSNINGPSPQTIFCHGSNSCANIRSTDVKNTIYCTGANSCAHTNFNNASNSSLIDTITCSGFSSCANSQIRNTLEINAQGAYSLINATIYTVPKNILVVELSGHNAGFATRIDCSPGGMLLMTCKNDACQNLHVFGNCLGNVDTIDAINDTLYLPIEDVAMFPGPFPTAIADTMENDELCSRQNTLFTYDDSITQQSNINDIYSNENASICCRGYQSCTERDNIISNTSNKAAIICSGHQSCQSIIGNIQSVGPIFCSGWGACRNSWINSEESLFCLAYNACHGSTITSTPNIHCTGSNSCENTNIKSNGTDINIFFTGYLSGLSATIECDTGDTCSISCDGAESCTSLAAFQCDGTCIINCNQYTGCPPTYSPTKYPTKSPTKFPSKTPTKSPTKSPSTKPTSNPSIRPSRSPIRDGGVVESTATVTAAESKAQIADAQEELLNSVAETFQYANIVLIVLFLLIGVLGYIDATYFRINDVFRIGKIGTPLLHTLDTMSDVFLCWEVGSVYDVTDDHRYLILLIFMTIFVVVPMGFSLVQLAMISNKHWINQEHSSTLYMMNSAEIKVWFERYVYYLYTASIITGSSFSATFFFNSNIFMLGIFDMGLSDSSLSHFRTKRVYSIVLCENVPQLLLQIIYFFISSGQSIIAIVSMLYSAISILVSLIAIYTQRRIIYMQQAVFIRFDVCGNSIPNNSDKIRNRFYNIRRRLSPLLGVEKRLIEVLRPRVVSNGMRIILLVKVDGNIEEYTNNFEISLNEANDKGKFVQALKDAWLLPDVTADQTVSVFGIKFSSKQAKQSIAQSTNTSIQLSGFWGQQEGLQQEGQLDVRKANNDNDILDAVNKTHGHNNDDGIVGMINQTDIGQFCIL